MIQINKLTKKFGKVEILHNLTVTIEKGTITYLVGPNGAGKTTLIKCLLGLVQPTSGEIYINNLLLHQSAGYRNTIGYMPQYASFPENLTANEIITMLKEIRQFPNELDEKLLHLFQIEKECTKQLKNLSGGTRQKVNAIIAFLFNPPILILDEPTAGLDPISSSILKDKIIREKNKGKTILATSHILSELEDIAENIIFLLDGNICFAGEKKELIHTTPEKNLERAIAFLMTTKKR